VAGRGRTGALVIAGLCLAWPGCSVEKNYELLSFFFDGVPDPNAPVTRGGIGTAVVIASAHSAFADRRCEACHGSTVGFGVVVTGFAELDASVCPTCHTGIADEYPRLHGPVAGGECLWCHEPHESRYPNLQAWASPELCLGCHRLELESMAQPPEHEDLARDCLDCHMAHGGEHRYFLRPVEDTATESEGEGADEG
jgi:predicted CXXCH cytochrome family protein